MAMSDANTTATAASSGETGNRKTKQHDVLVLDPKRAKSLKKFLDKKRRKEEKRRRKEGKSSSSPARAPQQNNTVVVRSTGASLGDLSRSAIETLYGTADGAAGAPPHEKKRTKKDKKKKKKKDRNDRNAKKHPPPAAPPTAATETNPANDEDAALMPFLRLQTFQRTTSTKSDELFRAANSALEAFQRKSFAARQQEESREEGMAGEEKEHAVEPGAGPGQPAPPEPPSAHGGTGSPRPAPNPTTATATAAAPENLVEPPPDETVAILPSTAKTKPTGRQRERRSSPAKPATPGSSFGANSTSESLSGGSSHEDLETGADDPSAIKIVHYETQYPFCSIRRLVPLCLMVLPVVALWVVFGLYVGGVLGGGGGTGDPRNTTTARPNDPGSADITPELALVAATIRNEFGPGASERAGIPGSPQEAAAGWMATGGGSFASLVPPTDAASRKGFRQRYALAVLFFSTNGGGGDWLEADRFLSPDLRECDWLRNAPVERNDWGIRCDDDDAVVTGLDLRENGLSGSIPPEIEGLEGLRSLDLSGNSIGGTIPPEIAGLGQLESLSLSSNPLTGSLSSWIGGLGGTLRELRLERTLLSGTLPSELRRLVSLEVLELSGGAWTGSIPSEIAAAPSGSLLRVLDLSDNALTGRIPPSLARLENLQVLDVSENNLEGIIPAGEYPALREFVGHGNRFEGRFPGFLLVPSLERLSLEGNEISGPLPENGWSNTPGLSMITLSRNSLGGSMPTTMGSLTKLTTLVLEDCGLTGSLPATLANAALLNLNLEGNRLTGTVPRAYARLPLVFFGIGRNLLWGDISNSICLLPSIELATADCPDEVICSCCSSCFDADD